ncbi:MAG: phosphatase PAP2 family protein [Alteromonadales bacterium]|nr:phosphatase PAP2 family protein [Alteromonadales bacterium]
MATEQKRLWIFFIVSMWISIFITPQRVFASNEASIVTKIADDHSNYYSKERLKRVMVGFLAMGVVANSEIDGNLQDRYQDKIRSQKIDDDSKITKLFGEGKYLIPISILSSGAYYLDSNSEIGNWGLNSTRAYAVGLPAMWVMQNVTGASRPAESNGSKWKPFKDSNGVSGHAFVGAVPFLTLAQMNNNNTFIKYTFYVASGIAAWSRVNDDSHYTSQAILGWYMAYESVGAVFNTNDKSKQISFMPVIGNNFYGINIHRRW